MNGFIKSTMVAVCLASGLALGTGRSAGQDPDGGCAGGCCGGGGWGTYNGAGPCGGCGGPYGPGSKLQRCYYRFVDPCYPDRYWYMARSNVNAFFGGQVYNGHVLDQTVWNEHFEVGTDRLTIGGLYKLSIIAKRRPLPDCKVFLQTAQDVVYDPTIPERFAEKRTDLDARRVQAILRYLHSETASRPLGWDVVVHDPSEVGMAAVPMQSSILQRNFNFRGILPSTFGAGGGAGTPGAPGQGGAGLGIGGGGGVGGNAGGLAGRTGLGY